MERELIKRCGELEESLELLPSYGSGRRDESAPGRAVRRLHAALEKFLGPERA